MRQSVKWHRLTRTIMVVAIVTTALGCASTRHGGRQSVSSCQNMPATMVPQPIEVDVSLNGRVEQMEVSVGGGKTRKLMLYLPPQYDTDHDSLAVIYLLHGLNGNERAWMERGNAAAAIDSLITNRITRPVLLAMPDCSPHYKHKDRCMIVNMLRYPRWLRCEFEKEFRLIDSQLCAAYRVFPNEKVIAGLSAGATQAANLALMYDSLVSVVGLFSPVIHRRHLPADTFTEYWIGVGRHDIFRSESRCFIKKLDKRAVCRSEYISSGRHTWKNWRLYLVEFMKCVYGY